MESNENLLALIKQLREENEGLQSLVNVLREENETLKKDFSGDWVHSKLYRDAIAELRETQREYKKQVNEFKLIKAQYKKKMEELLDSYK